MIIIFIYVVSRPVSVTVTSSHANPIRPYGSNVTLTCTVELSPLVDVVVNVSTVWSGPAGFMATNSVTLIGSRTTININTTVNSFGTEQSGVYNCTAIISSRNAYLVNSDPLSGTVRITTSMFNLQSMV